MKERSRNLPATSQIQAQTVQPATRTEDKYVLPFFLLLMNDFLVFGASLLFAYWVRVALIVSWYPLKPGIPPAFWKYAQLAVVSAGLGVSVFGMAGFYRKRRGFTRFASLTRIATMVVLTYTILLALLSMYRGYSYSRLAIGISFLFALSFCLGSNLLLCRVQKVMVQRGIGFFRTLLIASDPSCRDLLPRLESTHGSLHQVVGVLLPEKTPAVRNVLGVPVMGDLEDLPAVCKAGQIDRVIIALPSDQHRKTLELMQVCEDRAIDCRIVPDLFEMLTLRMSVGELDGLPTITLGETPLEGSGRLIKRASDIVLSSILLMVTMPLMAVAAMLVKLTSKGPIFYTQERVGSDGRRFILYKLRTMRVDAEQSGIGWSVKDDPRMTSVGRILRKLDIDEFPQFFNVLTGDMSLVGPRPERPYYVDQFKRNIPQYMRRHMVKSGITGWAQVHGLRGDTSIEERVRYDIFYIEHWSLWLDVKILFLTFLALFQKN